jgi:hypothetical protein
MAGHGAVIEPGLAAAAEGEDLAGTCLHGRLLGGEFVGFPLFFPVGAVRSGTVAAAAPLSGGFAFDGLDELAGVGVEAV